MLQLESNFSRVASRIYTGQQMRSSSYFTIYNATYNVAPSNPTYVCPAIDYVATLPPAPGYTPLLSWDLAAMGVSLVYGNSYTFDINVFVNNLTGIDNTILVSLYDGTHILAVQRLAPAVTGPWGTIVTGSSGLNDDPASNFPLGLLTVLPEVVTPAGPLPLYVSRRVDLKVTL